jgi:hypothetical protein
VGFKFLEGWGLCEYNQVTRCSFSGSAATAGENGMKAQTPT